MRFILALATVLFICSEATGQTTRPAPSQWENLVKGIAACAGDEQTLRALTGPGCSFRRFDGDHNSDPKSLAESWPLQTQLGAHAYLFPPQMLAEDVAIDVGGSSLVPDRVKNDLALDDPIERNAAAAVAVKWVQQTLHVDTDSPVGLIVLWDTHSDVDEQHRLTFLLVQGRQEADGSFRIVSIVWGDPLP
jgi:hypothetical protein